MAKSATSNVYIQVIEDVVNKVGDEFVNNGGPGDSVLSELQAIWEMKMMQAGAIVGPIERNLASKPTAGGPITPVHDLNVPYEGTEEFETPTADLLFPPTPMQTPLPGMAQTPLPGTAQTPLPGTAQTPLPGTADSSLYNIPTGGTPQPSSPWLTERPPLDVNVAYVEGREDGQKGLPQPLMQDFFTMSAGKRKREDFPPQYHSGGYIPQQDGAGDTISDDWKVVHGNSTLSNKSFPNIEIDVQGMGLSSKIPQLDGPIPDAYDDMLSTPNIYYNQGVVNEDYNIATPAANDMHAAIPAPLVQNDVVDDDDDDEPLNENDDDDDVDDVDQGEDLSTTHLVLAQFDKVTRTKSRWKCTLKDGIMHINNKDILFNKATGEFDF